MNKAVPLQVRDGARIELSGPVKEPTLANEQFDPFDKFKTGPDKYHYRALNIRPQNMRVRMAEGYETIEGSEYGDLILGKIPLEVHKTRIEKEEMKTKQRTTAAVDKFKEEAAAAGVKTFEY